MLKLFKQIRFVIYNATKKIILKLMALIPRNKNIFVFNCMTNSFNRTYGFTHNTKYLFLYLSNHNEYGIIPIWITPDKNIVKELSDNGYLAYYKYSLKGIYYCLRAKYYLLNIDILNGEISNWLSGGAIKINLWHGAGLKYLGKDNLRGKLPQWQEHIRDILLPKDDYFIANNELEVDIFNTAFSMKKEDVKILGSPRTDSIFQTIKGEELFMQKDIEQIKKIKELNKKLILYVPTYRDTGKDISGWINNPNIKEIARQNNAVLLCKLHPADNNSLSIQNSDELYKLDNNSDINAILKYTDILITDYSTVAFDYLLLDRPIIYYPLDLDEFQKTCHGFYHDYYEMVAGAIVYDENTLFQTIKEVLKGEDSYREERKILKDKLFKYQDGKNCERVINFIKGLNK